MRGDSRSAEEKGSERIAAGNANQIGQSLDSRIRVEWLKMQMQFTEREPLLVCSSLIPCFAGAGASVRDESRRGDGFAKCAGKWGEATQ